MTYFYVDDGLHGNAKARAVSLAAMGLWVLSGSLSGDQLSEGHVPAWFVDSIKGGRAAARALVDIGLWHGPGERCKSKICPARKTVPEGEFVFHDWSKVNRKTKAQVEADRAATAIRVQRHRERQSNAVTTQHQSSPVHTKPKDLQDIDPPVTSQRAKANPEDRKNPVATTGDTYQSALAATAARMTKEAGREVTLLEAGVIVDWILDRSKSEVRMPKRYVMGTLTRDWAVWTRYVHDGVLPE